MALRGVFRAWCLRPGGCSVTMLSKVRMVASDFCAASGCVTYFLPSRPKVYPKIVPLSEPDLYKSGPTGIVGGGVTFGEDRGMKRRRRRVC